MSIKSYQEFVRLNEEEEGSMYIQQLQEIGTNATELREMIQPDDDVEAWVQNKIAVCHQMMDGILSYYKSKKHEKISPSQGETTSINLMN